MKNKDFTPENDETIKYLEGGQKMRCSLCEYLLAANSMLEYKRHVEKFHKNVKSYEIWRKT